MTPQTTIARADTTHLDALLPLFLGYQAFYGKSVAAQDARHFLSERLRLNQSTIFLAWRESQAVGFVQLYPAFASLSLAPSWILNDLFVKPDVRGSGVAEALMAAARSLAEANGAAEIFLQTARTNAVAQRLYERLGYRRDDDFLVYTLSLPRH
jgi:ribosomal protein S18 acetylase RimI-like enzyme